MKATYYGYRILDRDKQDDSWKPENLEDFDFSIDFYAGADVGGDAFTLEICSPGRFITKCGNSVCSGQGILIMPLFDLAELDNFLREVCANTEAKTWDALALKLNSVGRWEFAYSK